MKPEDEAILYEPADMPRRRLGIFKIILIAAALAILALVLRG